MSGSGGRVDIRSETTPHVSSCQETSPRLLSDRSRRRSRSRVLTQARRESAYWRDLLRRIARDMDSAARVESDPRRQQWFTSRAARVRERLARGVPEDWREADTETRATASTGHVPRRTEGRSRRT